LHDQHIRLLCLNEDNVSLVREAQQVNLELAAANGQLEHTATTDALTQIANRRRFDSSLTEAVRRAQREGTALTLLFLDIDSFKGFNDLYGHQAGDTCLQRVAAGLSSSFRRPGDLVARYGGEEFSVILPRTDLGAALALAEAVRYNIEALALRNAASAAGVISVSIGVTSFAPELYARPEDFIRSADEALYAAKRAGRNCVRATRDGDCRSSVSVSAVPTARTVATAGSARDA
jgi:diguanylate cyclase (GGDEF)-like protein